MAYMNQETKRKIAPVVKAILKKYGCTGSLSVRNHSTLELNIRSGRVDPFKDSLNVSDHDKRYNTIGVNHYWYRDHFEGKTKALLSEIIPAMNQGNHDNSDASVDYFDVGWYIEVRFGDWKKGYQLLT